MSRQGRCIFICLSVVKIGCEKRFMKGHNYEGYAVGKLIFMLYSCMRVLLFTYEYNVI